MLKKMLISLFSSLAFLSSVGVLASHCPLPNEIHYVPNAGGTANWMAPGYEGFTQGPYLGVGDTHIDKFKQVEWGRKNGVHSGPGSTLCFYTGKNGTLVMMVQNKWGGVKQPDHSNWHWGYDVPISHKDALTRVLICKDTNVQNCQFS